MEEKEICQCTGEEVFQENSIYLPKVATLLRKEQMTPFDTFFEFELKGRSLGHLPGQFAEISIPGIGEAPISISSPPSEEKTFEMVNNLKCAMEKINRELVEEWIRDLVIVKTFAGLKFQEAILGKGAEKTGKEYRLAKPDEEARGIDGYIGNIPVSIKPKTYRSMMRLPENVNVRIIYYNKVKDGIEVDYGEVFS